MFSINLCNLSNLCAPYTTFFQRNRVPLLCCLFCPFCHVVQVNTTRLCCTYKWGLITTCKFCAAALLTSCQHLLSYIAHPFFISLHNIHAECCLLWAFPFKAISFFISFVFPDKSHLISIMLLSMHLLTPGWGFAGRECRLPSSLSPVACSVSSF